MKSCFSIQLENAKNRKNAYAKNEMVKK